MSEPEECKHLDMSCMPLGKYVFIRCLSCRVLARLKLVDTVSFTTLHARIAINNMVLKQRISKAVHEGK